jgi:SAM-dependent methyltransferase
MSMQHGEYLFKDGSRFSHDWALRILPVVLEITGVPESVVDLGGGLGQWCSAFKKLGTRKVRCIDHPSVRNADLLIESAEFVRCDLAQEIPPAEPFDIAISVEFAEHVPATRNADIVRFLTDSSDIVLFSAAIPRQPGQGHINTHLARYWREVFGKRSFDRYDVIRPQILFEESIPSWLRQNLFLYANSTGKSRLSLPKEKFLPDGFELICEDILNCPPNLSEILANLPSALKRAIFFRLPKVRS